MRRSRNPALALRIALLALIVGGCSFAPQREAPEGDPQALWQARAATLQALDSWTFSGRAALSGDEVPSRTVRLRWLQHGEAFDIAFQSPIGQRLAELTGDAGGVTLRLPGEAPVAAAGSEALLEAELGWSAPVESLRYWVLGLPDPAAREAPELDPWGRIVRLRQGGWLVEYDRYFDLDGLELPRRLTVTHPGLRIRLVVDRWELEDDDDRA